MENLLQEMADNWFVLVMFTIFIGIIIFAFRPSAKDKYEKLRSLPLRDDDVLVEDESGEK
ncbi:MAG: cbb3-type cytochrome c oxidase subunit 3 [Rhodobacteraceae bacterium]|nr:cbb3-type cytochrome c oxidase subunit 3 [Paracoccaceae bacterium]